jgi:SAM-dependent methyltransferase
MTRTDAEAARASWDESADAYHRFIDEGLDYYRTELHGPALLAACGDVAGRDVLDLGSGQGWFSRHLAGRGARVVGVDWSARLVEHARRIEAAEPRGVRYEVRDAATIDEAFAPASFDRVSACMSLQDMPAPGRVLAAARRLLRPGGSIVVSVPQPVTDSPVREWVRAADGTKRGLTIDGYFEASAQIMEWNMARLPERFRTVQYRHTLEGWSRLVEDAGLVVARLREPRADAAMIARYPPLADAARLPYFLILDLRPA